MGETERQEGGFGSTGKTVIKKMRFEDVEPEIKLEEAISVENDIKVIAHEKIDH